MPKYLLVAISLFAAVPAALASEAPPDAETLARGKVLFENGATLYAEGNYEAAIAAFEEALRLTGEKSLYYNIANCYERLGRWQEAYDALNMYRAFAPAEERETLERRIRSVDDRLRAEREARIAAPTPAPQPEPTPAPQPTPAPAPARPSYGTANWALLGTGAALAVGGGVGIGVTFSGAKAAREAGDVDAYNGYRAGNIASIALTGVGAALAVVGAAVPLDRSGTRVGWMHIDGTTTLSLNGTW